MTEKGFVKPFLAFIWFLTLHGVTRNVFFSLFSFFLYFFLSYFLFSVFSFFMNRFCVAFYASLARGEINSALHVPYYYREMRRERCGHEGAAMVSDEGWVVSGPADDVFAESASWRFVFRHLVLSQGFGRHDQRRRLHIRIGGAGYADGVAGSSAAPPQGLCGTGAGRV